MTKTNTIFDKILGNRIFLHILFWLAALLIFPFYAIGFQPFKVSLIIKAFALPVQMLAFYYLVYYQVPKYLYKKKYVRFIIFMLLGAVVFCTLSRLVEMYLFYPSFKYWYPRSNAPAYDPNAYIEILSNPFLNVFKKGLDDYVTVFIAAAIKFLKLRFEEKQQIALLQKEKAKAEINFLKAQVNPRVLSKTLHQLHTLTKEKSDAAPEVVIKLSDMLDYMLYQCNASKVLIRKEIELVQNYLDLEKLRYGADLTIHFYHELENNFSEITPLLLLSLVEAAFLKEEGVLPKNAKVEILLKQKGAQLNFKIFSHLNTFNKDAESNFKKQLELLYPEQYQLERSDNEEEYALTLNLQL